MRHVSRTHRVALDWLVDRISLGPKSKSNLLTRKNQLADILTKGSFSRDEWNHLLCLFNIMSFSRYSCCHCIDFLSDDPDPSGKQNALSKRSQKTSSNEGSPTAKAKPFLVLREREQRSEQISSQSLGSRINPESADERKEVVRLTRQRVLPNSNSEIGHPQASRQENSQRASRKLVPENPNRTESDERTYSDSKSSRKLAASSPELKNMEWTNHHYMSKIFQCLQKKLEMSATNATFSMDAYKTNVLMLRVFMTSSMKAAIHLGPNFKSNSEIYKSSKIEDIESVNICSCKLDVSETNVSIPQIYRIRNHIVGCWTANGWITCSGFMGCGDRSVTFIEEYRNHQPIPQQETVPAISNPTPHTLLNTCQEPTELRLIGCSTGSMWTPRSKSNMLTLKNNSPTC